jgi:hypothetical protein
MRELDRDVLIRIMEFLEIPFDYKATKAKLIVLLQNYQKEILVANAAANETPEIPRYSVRVKRIMDSMNKEK